MDAVEEIKSRLNIEDVVSEYVQLKRSGRNFKGLSPFADEKTPSFMVSAEKQIWHDFSSGKGGNMFSFVMEMEGLDFKGALELLARKASVDLDQFRQTAQGSSLRSHKERLYEALEAAAHFYQLEFKKKNSALEYIFKKRRFSKEIVLAFRLGYAPNSGSALITYLKDKKFTEKEIQGAGLSSKAYRGGTQDMFRGRIMVPLQDPQGRVIGFTARLLIDDKNAPKYINTPQTILYDKSRHVYGLHLAKDAVRKQKFAVLVEGNLDVIASHQAGVKQVVATAGTALTEQHLKTLGRFTDDIRLSFDADNAGTNATERAIPIASKVGVSLGIISIPEGKDPDELIKSGGVETWEHIIQNPKYALDWLMDKYQHSLDIDSAKGKKEFSDVILPIVQKLQDSVEQDHYVRKISQLLHISREALTTKSTKTRQKSLSYAVAPKKPAAPQKTSAVPSKIRNAQNNLLAILLFHPELIQNVALIRPDMLIGDTAKKILAELRNDPANAQKYTDDGQEQSDYVKMIGLDYERWHRGAEPTDLIHNISRYQADLIDQYVKTENAKISLQYYKDNDDAGRGLLDKQYNELVALQTRAKGGMHG
jgi:DNA primase